MFTFQDVPGVPVWCRETWTRTLIYIGLGRNPYRLPVIVNALSSVGLVQVKWHVGVAVTV